MRNAAARVHELSYDALDVFQPSAVYRQIDQVQVGGWMHVPE
jgi:hypothetical protein